MLHIKNICASANETSILKGVSLIVNPGEFHLILGKNGSGKSTLGKVLLGSPEYTVSSGEIWFQNENITEISTFKRAQKGIFLSHQSPPALDGISTKELLRAAQKENPNIEKESILQFKKTLAGNLESMGLSKTFLERDVNVGASGGERKKLEMTSLLMLHPTLAFLDEIDSGVDIDAMKAIGEGIKKYLENKNTSLILVSHSNALFKYISPTHVHIFSDGKIIETGGMELATKIHEGGF